MGHTPSSLIIMIMKNELNTTWYQMLPRKFDISSLLNQYKETFLMTILQFFSDYSLLCVGNLKANFITHKKTQILQ